MRSFHDKYKTDIHSQTGEDGVLDETFRRMNITNGTFCEFGAHNGKYCSNTRHLLEQGWTGKLIEANLEHSKALIDNTSGMGVDIHFGPVTVENVNELIPELLNLLSIDVDNDDFHLWNAYRGHADVVVIEVNSSIAPPKVVIPGQAGSSYSAMVMLGIAKGYFLLTHHGNCIFVENSFRSLFPEMEGDGFKNWEKYFSNAWL